MRKKIVRELAGLLDSALWVHGEGMFGVLVEFDNGDDAERFMVILEEIAQEDEK